MKNIFDYKKLSEEQLERMEKLRKGFSDLDDLVREKAKDGRYKSLTLTAIEEASLWAAMAIGNE